MPAMNRVPDAAGRFVPGGSPASATVTRPTPVHTLLPQAAQAAAPMPEQAAAGRPVGRVGSAVIDLAIREARLNPAAPRRRRISGR
jgi:hypothetical protein